MLRWPYFVFSKWWGQTSPPNTSDHFLFPESTSREPCVAGPPGRIPFGYTPSAVTLSSRKWYVRGSCCPAYCLSQGTLQYDPLPVEGSTGPLKSGRAPKLHVRLQSIGGGINTFWSCARPCPEARPIAGCPDLQDAVCVYVCIFVSPCVFVCTLCVFCACLYISMCVYVIVYTFVCVCICVMYVCVCGFICCELVCLCTCVSVYVCMCLYVVYLCVFTFICVCLSVLCI